MIILRMKIQSPFFIYDGHVHFLCLPKENELPKGQAKAPKECLRQKGTFSSAGMPLAEGVFWRFSN
jgi:hypothetical protein